MAYTNVRGSPTLPIETNHQSGDCWNWKDNSDLKSEARDVRMGSNPISPIQGNKLMLKRKRL